MSSYEYSQLTHPREIRLLSLQQQSSDGALSVRIETASLDGDLDFVALSYVWGPQEPSSLITCDTEGSTLPVGSNLETLLRLLVESQGWTDKLYVDRLCINQDDLDERGKQVAMMGDIYSKAKIVLVWLGNALKTTKRAFDVIGSLSEDLVREERIYKQGHTTEHSVKYPSFDSEDAAAVRELLGMERFKRVWTYQEIVLAKNAIIKCGIHHLPWVRLTNLLQGLEKFPPGPTYGSNFLRGVDDAAFEMVKNRAYRKTPDLNHHMTGPMNTSLMALLHELRKRQATDPRDKVYALLNVASDISAANLIPDYRISHLEAYAQTAKCLLKKHENLAFLALVEIKDRPDLVSWVPDFRSKDELNFLHQARLTFRPTQKIWRASGSCKAVASHPETPLLRLPVGGVCIGKIVATTEPAGNLVGNMALGDKVLDGGQWHKFAHTVAQQGQYLPTGESIDLAFQRARIWDCRPNEAVGRLNRSKPLTMRDFPTADLPTSARAIANLNDWKNDDMASRILNGTTRKRMLKTDTGYLGLAPRRVEPGDEMWVLLGSDTPCVLKKIGADFYSFGGEAYVHGAMDGEILLRVAGRRTATESIDQIDENDMQWLDGLGQQGLDAFPIKKLILF